LFLFWFFSPAGSHGSTFGGNPLACTVARAALGVLVEERLAENAERMGAVFRREIAAMDSEMVEVVRGRGLLNALVIRESKGRTAWDLCLRMRDLGLLAKPTHGNIIRMAPPLIIKDAEMKEGLDIIKQAVHDLMKK
jgi:ornithine--oxo-acid transaminase